MRFIEPPNALDVATAEGEIPPTGNRAGATPREAGIMLEEFEDFLFKGNPIELAVA